MAEKKKQPRAILGSGDIPPALWVPGLACVLLALTSSFYPFQGKALEWAVYFTFGTLFPALLLFIAGVQGARPRGSAVAWVPGFFALALLPLGLRLFEPETAAAQLGLSLALGYVAMLYSPLKFKTPGERLRFFAFLSLGTALSWECASRLEWWVPKSLWFAGERAGVLAGAFVAVGFALYILPRSEAASRLAPASRKALSASAIPILALLSLRTDRLFEAWDHNTAWSHWGVFAGPAELVRQGGWLLWDVPAQYGFLSTLTLAWMPTGSTWQSLFVLDALLLLLSAGFVFALLRRLGSGPLNWAFALALAAAAVFFLPGYAPNFQGPHVQPSIGAVRFIWCYALVGFLILELNRKHAPLWPGHLIYLAGSLWSFESLIYCTGIWLPSCVALSVRRKRLSELAWPPALLAGAGALISVYYLARLGHLPDWRAYADYALAFQGGFGALPVERNSAVWVLFLLLCALAALIVELLRRERRLREALAQREIPLAAGLWGMLFATASYFIGRSHDNNITNLAPLHVTVLAGSLLLIDKSRLRTLGAELTRIVAALYFAVLLTLAYGNGDGLKLILNDVERAPDLSVKPLLLTLREPALKDLQALLHRGQVLPGDLAVLVHMDYLPMPHRAWLPSDPFTLLDPLPRERQEVYLSRFAERRRLGGWLITPRSGNATGTPWIEEWIKARFHPTQAFENAAWTMRWYDYGPGT